MAAKKTQNQDCNACWQALEEMCPSSMARFISFLYSIITAYAVYLAFVKNNGFNLGGFLAASIMPLVYIPWKLSGQ